jgi:hypothetical protein
MMKSLYNDLPGLPSSLLMAKPLPDGDAHSEPQKPWPIRRSLLFVGVSIMFKLKYGLSLGFSGFISLGIRGEQPLYVDRLEKWPPDRFI